MYNVKINSKEVKPGDIFVAIKGYNVDGHDYIESAINNGATKIIATHGKYSVETIIVPDTLEYITNYLKETYKDILSEMSFVGLTGTNGKTTTCYLTYQYLNKLGIKTAYIGTLGFYLESFVHEISNTTPNIVDLYALIIKAYEDGYRHVVLEVSSHALDLNRVDGLHLDIAGFTNLTQDHLDYHKTIDNYLKAKLNILNISKKMVVNIDDEFSKYFITDSTLTFGFSNADFKVISSHDNEFGTTINFINKEKEYTVNTNLKGKFNIYNFMMCIAICSNYFAIEEIIFLSKEIYPPKGRCQIIPVKGGIAVVDYAHTPDAVLKIIQAFQERKKGRLITIVGCGGDRDPLKRPLMGNVASVNSDYTIFTSDNPRTEDPLLIMKDVISGVEVDNYEVIIDRKNAIEKALDLIKDNDVVLILGKGHEDYQIIGRDKIHFDDAEQVKNYIQELNKK